MSDEFRHTPLNGPWQIRLVHLLPGQRSDKIACEIRAVSRNDVEKKYSAVSYTWGGSTKECTILLNGSTFHVTKNLYSFLHNGRHNERTYIYWIDAICINQSDTEERNSQVGEMKSVYENADQVLVWLGPAADDSHLAMDKLRNVAKTFKELAKNKRNDETHEGFVRRFYVDCGDEANSWILGPPPFDPKPWVALRRLLNRPWWTRLWVVQECSTERDTIFTCGSQWLRWIDLQLAIVAIYSFAFKYDYEALNDLPTWRAGRLRDFQTSRSVGGEELHLINLLEVLRRCDCTDPRDKVYAVIGLATNIPRSSDLPVDYNKSWQEVYTDVARYSIMTSPYGHKLDILGYRSETSEADESLPSWVPDWRSRRVGRPFVKKLQAEPGLGGGHESIGKAYSASGGSLDFIPRDIGEHDMIRIIEDELQVKGFRIDIIEGFHSLDYLWGDDSCDTPEKRFRAILNGPSHYFTGETLRDAFLRTIVADVKLDYGRPTARGYAMTWPPEDYQYITEAQLVPYTDRISSLIHTCKERSLVNTRDGMIGLVPQSAQKGDEIYLLFGGQVFYVLRLVRDHYRLVGECYIHGLMNGEALEWLNDVSVSLHTVKIR